MALKNATTKPLRFRVERMVEGFAVVDTIDIKIHEFASRQAAELECAARNGTGQQKTTESSVHQQFREKLRKGVTFEDIDVIEDACDSANALFRQPELLRPLIAQRATTAQRAKRAAADYRNWLPPMLRKWANEVAVQCGYGGTKRRSWHAYLVFNAVQAEGDKFTFRTPEIRTLHSEVWPSLEWHSVEIELRRVLAMHYLSPDPAHVKARYFGGTLDNPGVSERTYQRQVDSALQWLAAHWVGGNGNDAQWPSDADDVSEDDDFDAWGIDAHDRANLRTI